jgi:cysteine desulfuration protein SufE
MVQTSVVPAETIADIQRTIVEDFGCFDDWTERYQYLIELGRKLPPFPEEKRIDANRLHGCQAQVWFFANYRQGRLFFQATSDSAIVAGLIALLVKVYSGHTPEEIRATPPEFVEKIGLAQHLSPYRANGLSLMLARIRAFAAAHISGHQAGEVA